MKTKTNNNGAVRKYLKQKAIKLLLLLLLHVLAIHPLVNTHTKKLPNTSITDQLIHGICKKNYCPIDGREALYKRGDTK